MATDFQIIVSFTPGQALATWSLDGKTDFTIKAQKGDSLTFTFNGPDPAEQMSDGIVLSGPRKQSPHVSPFQKTQLPIKNGGSVAIENDGSWGFSIAFTTTRDTLNGFYFLPDPELEVGSTCV